MASHEFVLRELNGSDQRRGQRFPNSTIWSEQQRHEYRETRDTIIEAAGLITPRMLDGQDEVAASAD